MQMVTRRGKLTQDLVVLCSQIHPRKRALGPETAWGKAPDAGPSGSSPSSAARSSTMKSGSTMRVADFRARRERLCGPSPVPPPCGSCSGSGSGSASGSCNQPITGHFQHCHAAQCSATVVTNTACSRTCRPHQSRSGACIWGKGKACRDAPRHPSSAWPAAPGSLSGWPCPARLGRPQSGRPHFARPSLCLHGACKIPLVRALSCGRQDAQCCM